VQIRRTVRAKRDRVFRAWTDAEDLKRWWGPGEFTTPVAEVDARPGGSYLLVMQPPHGDAMRLVGTYREVDPPERLVYTWRWDTPWSDGHESVVTVEFVDKGDDTEVVLTHDHFGPEGEDPYRDGWEGGLDKLERTVAHG
jgi:uncharacterized protein YndB with AHSA1/START domain